MSIEVMGGGGGYPEYVQGYNVQTVRITSTTSSITFKYNKIPQHITYLYAHAAHGSGSSQVDEMSLTISGGYSGFSGKSKSTYNDNYCKLWVRTKTPNLGYYLGQCDITTDPDNKSITFFNFHYLGETQNITLPLGSYSDGNWCSSSIAGYND